MGLEQSHHHPFETKAETGRVGGLSVWESDVEGRAELVLVVVERTTSRRIFLGNDRNEHFELELLLDLAGGEDLAAAAEERIGRDIRLGRQLERLKDCHAPLKPLIALTFVLTVDDAERFNRSRDVGCYVGLRPKQSDSGASQPPLRITKEGDGYLRKLLVQGAHCILSRRGPDTDLQRFGRKLSERGGKNAKKRAVVAVARKLAVLLHRLWVTGEVYEPLRNNPAERAKAA